METNIASSLQKLHEIISHVSSSKIISLKCILDGESFNDRSHLSHTISHIHDNTSCLSLSVERENCLVLKVDSGDSEGFEEDFSNLGPV